MVLERLENKRGIKKGGAAAGKSANANHAAQALRPAQPSPKAPASKAAAAKKQEQPPTPRQRPSSAQEPPLSHGKRKGGDAHTPRSGEQQHWSDARVTPDARGARSNGKRETFSDRWNTPSQPAFGGARPQSARDDWHSGGGGSASRGRGRGQLQRGSSFDSPRDDGWGGGKGSTPGSGGGKGSFQPQSTPQSTYKRITPQVARAFVCSAAGWRVVAVGGVNGLWLSLPPRAAQEAVRLRLEREQKEAQAVRSPPLRATLVCR